jgi:predicted MFS family arabinose efflux permease
MSYSISLSTLVGMLCFPLAGRWVANRGGRIVMLGSIAAWILNYTLYSMTSNPYLVVLIFIMPIYPFFLVSTNALAANASRSERRGGGLGALAGVSAFSMAMGTVLGGLTGDYISLAAIPIVSALGSCLALISLVLLIKLEKRKSRIIDDERHNDRDRGAQGSGTELCSGARLGEVPFPKKPGHGSGH